MINFLTHPSLLLSVCVLMSCPLFLTIKLHSSRCFALFRTRWPPTTLNKGLFGSALSSTLTARMFPLKYLAIKSKLRWFWLGHVGALYSDGYSATTQVVVEILFIFHIYFNFSCNHSKWAAAADQTVLLWYKSVVLARFVFIHAVPHADCWSQCIPWQAPVLHYGQRGMCKGAGSLNCKVRLLARPPSRHAWINLAAIE